MKNEGKVLMAADRIGLHVQPSHWTLGYMVHFLPLISLHLLGVPLYLHEYRNIGMDFS